ncbi:MAG TPA: carboxypeptidase-like regulatory domain-containing protein [Acidimicrobiales bacterium]|nr:carboxypeptidase-like regulatory domain-containing protein [Acidimicrobiales bacterium]
MRRRPTVLAALAAMAGASVVVVAAATTAAQAQPSWSAVNPPMPADAVAGQGLTVASSSCPAEGWCVGVGNYFAQSAPGSYYVAGLLLAESGGTWSAAEAPLPSGAATDPHVTLTSVSCPSVGSCVAVGSYVDASAATQGLIEVLSGGTWSATEEAVPPGSQTSGTTAYAQFSSVVCATAGACTAVGEATTAAGGQQAVVDSLSGGVWTSAYAPLPGAASGSQFLSLSCPTSSTCVAAGTYEVNGIFLGTVDSASGGVWTAAALPLPAGASPLASIANNDLSVSCVAPGTCAAAATTFDGNYEGVLDTESGGTWSASPAPVPGGQSTTDLQLTAVSCSDAVTCVASGLVELGGVTDGLFESLAGGAWSAAGAPVPAGTDPATAVSVGDVACPADGTCVADGQGDLAGTVNGLLWNLSGGTWSTTAAPMPGDAGASTDPSFAPLSCPAVGACLALGTYLNTSGVREGVIDTDPSLAASTTSATLQAVSSSAAVYGASVAGAGATPTGTVVFSSGLVPLCSAPLVAGSASCTGPVAAGSTVLASYSGDSTFSPSWGTVTNPGAPVGSQIVAGWIQSASVNSLYAKQLEVRVVSASGAGVPGVTVTFTPPQSGPTAYFFGPVTAVSNASGYALSSLLISNNKAGSFDVVAKAAGVAGTNTFYLTNTKG